MGTGGSMDARKHSEIEQRIASDRRASKKTIKLLLLGAGESGKSTVLKQIRIIHDKGFSKRELEELRAHVYANILENTTHMIRAMEKMKIMFQGPKCEKYALEIKETYEDAEKGRSFPDHISPEMGQSLQVLWADPGMKEVYERRSLYQLTDSIRYFLDNMERIGRSDYVPSEQDVLFLRIPSRGVVETRIAFKQYFVNVVDVAGQRSERRKWLKCFDNVEGVMFVLAVNEYDQVIAEDNKTNRVQEALRVFASVCNSDFFLHSAILIFLNKKDILKEKIDKKISIKTCFPEYEDPLEYKSVIKFISNRIQELHINKSKTIYTHETCATDTQQLKFVLNACLDIVMQENMKKIGIVT